MWTTVGVERFELSTSRTRTVRSTGLSHTPIKNPGIQKRANYTIAHLRRVFAKAMDSTTLPGCTHRTIR